MRDLYHEQLDAIRADLGRMAGRVQASVREATTALLDCDARLAERVIAGDELIDRERDAIESSAFDALVRQQPVAGDLRLLVGSLRMVADLERMGDYGAHVAKVARLRYPDCAIPPELRETIRRMGTLAEHMVGEAANVLAAGDVAAAVRLEELDDEMDGLHRSLFRILLRSDWQYGVEPAVDIALLGRYYERLADHAVSMARRVVYLVTGEMPSPAS